MTYCRRLNDRPSVNAIHVSDMLDLIGHLIPDFSKLLTDGNEALTAWFVLIQLFICITTIVYTLLRAQRRFKQNINGIGNLTKGQTASDVARNRLDTLEQARNSKNRTITTLWTEFDKSLVASTDRLHLYTTLDAGYFFNPRTLAPELTENRLLNAMPSILVAVGILGTFIGLTIGLSGLNGSTGEIDTLKAGINQLISGSVIAFSSSVWGVFLSIFLNFCLKFLEGRANKRIHQLQNDIDTLYKRQTPEESLQRIADDAEQSRAALQELHERIGNRLQESVQALSTELEGALTNALNKIMEPAIRSLVDSSSQQSSHALEKLVQDFMTGMNSAGSEQAQRMNDAAASVNSAVSNLADNMQQMFSHMETQQQSRLLSEQENTQRYNQQLAQMAEAAALRETQLEQKFSGLVETLSVQIKQQMGSLDDLEQKRSERHAQQFEELSSRQQALLNGIAEAVQNTQAQSLQMADQHQHLLGDLQKASQANAQSSEHMGNIASQLGELSRNLHGTVEMFSRNLAETTRQIQAAIQESSRVSGHVDRQILLMQQLQQTLISGAQHFEQGAQQAHQGFESLKQHQQSFLGDLRQQFQQLGQDLQTQIREVEEQASEWLNSYSEAVREQTQLRMNEWNKQTADFSKDMVRTIEAMQSMLDELEQRK